MEAEASFKTEQREAARTRENRAETGTSAVDVEYLEDGSVRRQGQKATSPGHMETVLTAVGAAVLPRKEVIQPQLPLRLPCYDFTPITDPTFDGCVPCGLAHRLRVLPTFVV